MEDCNLRLSTRFLEYFPVTSPSINQKKICTQWMIRRPWLPLQMSLPLKKQVLGDLVKQNLGSWFLDMSLPPPQAADLLNKIILPFQPTLVSQVLTFKHKQPNLSLVYTHTHTRTHIPIYRLPYTHTHIYTHMVFVL